MVGRIIDICPSKVLLLIADFYPSSKVKYLLRTIVDSRRRYGREFHFGGYFKKDLTLITAFGVDGYGITDRLKAMTSIYGFCSERGYKFEICQHEPFELSDYLIPNQYDWTPSEDTGENTSIILGSSQGLKPE